MKQFEKRLANKGSQIRACRKFFQIVEKPKTDLEILAQKSMLENMSYQLPESAKHDRLIGLKELWRSFKDSTDEKWAPTSTPRLILDGRKGKEVLRKEYTQSIYKKEFSFVSRDALRSNQGNVSNPIKVWILLKGLKDGVKVFFFEENRVNIALKHRSIRELLSLISLLKRNGVEEVHDFNQYEIDSNVYYLVLKEVFGEELKIYKYPSPGPLYLHNSILITDVLCYNTPYHLEEIRKYNETIRYDKLKRVPMEQFFNYQHRYQKKMTNLQNDFELAFYSHASWLRAKHGHSEDGLNIGLFEDKLLKCLMGYLHDRSESRLVIYTHPRERMDNVIEDTVAFYDQYFGGNSRVKLCDKATTSSLEFMRAKLGVGVYSTILFERLACGSPTLILTPTSTFPLSTSRLSNVVIDEANAHEKIKGALKLSVQEFFDQHEINDYVEPLLISDH